MKIVANVTITLYDDYNINIFDMKDKLLEVINYSTIGIDGFFDVTGITVDVDYLCDDNGDKVVKQKSYTMRALTPALIENIIITASSFQGFRFITKIQITMYTVDNEP